jgi:uncharacterized protein YegL
MMDLEFGNSDIRRLPIYLLLDISGSMSGAPIEAVNQGVNLLYNELMNDPSAIETAYISIITFASQAKMVIPLTELTNIQIPKLQAGGATALGAALGMLNNSLDQDVRVNTSTQKGDYKPLVFLMTDGMPTDHWEQAADTIKQRTKQKIASIIALGCGGGVDINTLRRITEIVLLMDNITPDQITQYFKWVSQSVSQASVAIQASYTSEAKADLPPPPSGIRVVL